MMPILQAASWIIIIWLLTTALVLAIVHSTSELRIPKTRRRYCWIAVRLLLVQTLVYAALLGCGLSINHSIIGLAIVTLVCLVALSGQAASGAGATPAELWWLVVFIFVMLGVIKFVLGTEES